MVRTYFIEATPGRRSRTSAVYPPWIYLLEYIEYGYFDLDSVRNDRHGNGVKKCKSLSELP